MYSLEKWHTALRSLVAPETINIMMKLTMISTTSDCMVDPDGVVPKNALGVMSMINANVPLARTAPRNCDTV